MFFTKTFSWTESLSFKLRKKFGNTGLIVFGAAVLSISGFFSLIHNRRRAATGKCDYSRNYI